MNTQQKTAAMVRAFAAANRLKQTDIAAVLGLSQRSAGLKMNGDVAWSLDDVQVMAKHFGITPEQLMAGPWALVGVEAPDLPDTRLEQFCDAAVDQLLAVAC